MDTKAHKTYEDGLRDGQLVALEKSVGKHADRLDSHSHRLSVLERICWIMFGIVATIQFIPAIQRMVSLLVK